MTATSRPPPSSRKRGGAGRPRSGSTSPAQAEHLLHELHVHQIELEMQNEELRRTQLALEESRDRYVDLYEFAPVGYATLTAGGLIEEANLTAATLLAAERTAIRSSRFSAWVVPDDGDTWHRFRGAMMREPGGTRRTVELTLRRADGTTFPAQLDCVRLAADSQCSRIRVAISDISARVQAEAERSARVRQEHRRHLATRDMLAEERERQAIATDLHDGPGQTLHVARIKLDALAKGLPDPSSMTARVQELNDLLADASRQVRSLTSKLSPPGLLDLGLVPALSWLAEEIGRVYGLAVAVEDDGVPKRLTAAQTSILFRAARELLINVAKHAGVASARVRIDADHDRVRLAVTDRGTGMGDRFTADHGGPGFGLPSIHERVSFLGGSMEIKTDRAQGTEVVLDIPLVDGEVPR